LRNQRTETVCHWACGNSQVQLRVLVLTTTSVTLRADRGRRCRPARHHTGEMNPTGRAMTELSVHAPEILWEDGTSSYTGQYREELTIGVRARAQLGRGRIFDEPPNVGRGAGLSLRPSEHRSGGASRHHQGQYRGGRAHWRSEVGLAMVCPAQLADARMTLARSLF
jgi:hypothetical protein